MSYFRHGDPLDDFDRYDMEQARREARRPICSECGEHIMDETAFCKDGVWTCERCIEKQRTWIDDED